MNIGYMEWHDGIGYDIAALNAASEEDKKKIEAILLARGVLDWRDVEALAALKTQAADSALSQALETGSAEIRMAIHRDAPHLLTDQTRTKSLINALETADFYSGLSQSLDEAIKHHPPEVIKTLIHCALHRDGLIAVHFAALLFYLHGKADSKFDAKHHPFFLRFTTKNPAERQAALDELREIIALKQG
jgi:hypothetical protein